MYQSALPTFEPWLRNRPLSILLSALVVSLVAHAGRLPIDIITKDVAILGGGASGTYAAVRLREDYGQSVALIERGTVLGGNTNTYDNPETGVALNYGVQTYMDYMGAKPFFERFNIPLQGVVRFTSTTVYVDPNDGKLVPNVTAPPPISASIEALKKYLTVIAPWDNIMLPGYWDFPPGDQIPADLLLPFPDFVKKYGLEDAGPVLARVAGININSVQPALYVVMNFGTPVVQSYVNDSFFNPSPFNNSLVYGKSAQLLGSDVLLTSTVSKATRSNRGVTLLVENHSTGATKLVIAKRLLVSAPPSLKNLAPLGLDDQEKAVFSTWANKTSYAGIVKTNIIPDSTSVSFVAPANSTAALRPYSYSITWIGSPGYFRVLFSGRQAMTADEAKDAILLGLKTMAEGGAFPPVRGSVPQSEVVAISDHSSAGWNQTVAPLQGGFMQQLYALQAHRSTWYTGGLWCPDYSSNVWAFTDTVLAKMFNRTN